MEGRAVRLQHGLEVAGDVRLGLQVLGAVERYCLERHRRFAPSVSLACGSRRWRDLCDGSKQGAIVKMGGVPLCSIVLCP